jgi:DNA-binding transcriptional MerR regulator
MGNECEQVSVDAVSGYRYYSAAQLPRLNRILVLKDLGFSLVEIAKLGHTYLAAMKIREVARPLMQSLADLVQATVAMAEHDALHMVIVEVCRGSPSYKLRVEVGERVPRHLTALGRANLAATPIDRRAETVEAVCRQLAPDDHRSLTAEMLASLREYDKLGFVCSYGNWQLESRPVRSRGAADLSRREPGALAELQRTGTRDDSQAAAD